MANQLPRPLIVRWLGAFGSAETLADGSYATGGQG